VKQYTKLQSFIHSMNNHALSYRTSIVLCVIGVSVMEQCNNLTAVL